MKVFSLLLQTLLLMFLISLAPARAQEKGAEEKAGDYLTMARKAFAAKRYEEAITFAQREINADPKDPSAYRIKWAAMLKRVDFEKEIPVIRAEIEEILKSKIGREDALLLASYGYDAIADDAGRAKVEDLAVSEFPTGEMARGVLRNRALSEADKNKRAMLVEDFIARFPDDVSMRVMYPTLFRALASRPNEPGDKIAKFGLAWIKSVSEPYEVIISRWSVAVALAERRANLDLARSIAEEAVQIADSLTTESPSLGRVQEGDRPKFIETLKRRAHLARGFVLLRSGNPGDASKELRENLKPVIDQVEKDGYILWKETDLREIGVRPSVLWLAELYEAQGDFERARKYLLAGVGDDERANGYIRERLPIVFAKLGLDSSAAASSLSDAERRYNSLGAGSPALKEEAKTRALSNRVSKPAPDFHVLTLDKKQVRLSDLRGKVVVLNFWATWCGPCVAEMPHLEKAVAKYRGEPRVIFLSVSVDENKPAVRSFLERNKYRMLAAYDDGAAEMFGVNGIPSTFFIDRDGVIQFSEEGFGMGDTDYVERISWRVDELLKEKSAGVKKF